MSLLQSVREWLDEVFAEDTATDEVDEEYLERLDFEYIETSPDGYADMIRCDLCARLFDTMDDCVEHVAEHDEQGSASIDPFVYTPAEGGTSGPRRRADDNSNTDSNDSGSEEVEVKNR
jgi:hypothetical protein